MTYKCERCESIFDETRYPPTRDNFGCWDSHRLCPECSKASEVEYRNCLIDELIILCQNGFMPDCEYTIEWLESQQEDVTNG